MVFVLIGISVHPVWLALVGSYFLGYVPTTGTSSFQLPVVHAAPDPGLLRVHAGQRPASTCGGPIDWFYHLLLPWTVFAFLYAAFYVRLVRSQVMEVQNEDYVRTARAKGAPERRVLTQHVLRNAMLPVVTAFGMDVALALGGAVLLESVYGLPGLGVRGDQVAQPVRLPDHAGGGGVRLRGCDRVQPDRRPALRLDRSAHPARLTITYHPSIWPFSKSLI